jgi:hypothetical protein
MAVLWQEPEWNMRTWFWSNAINPDQGGGVHFKNIFVHRASFSYSSDLSDSRSSLCESVFIN